MARGSIRWIRLRTRRRGNSLQPSASQYQSGAKIPTTPKTLGNRTVQVRRGACATRHTLVKGAGGTPALFFGLALIALAALVAVLLALLTALIAILLTLLTTAIAILLILLPALAAVLLPGLTALVTVSLALLATLVRTLLILLTA